MYVRGLHPGASFTARRCLLHLPVETLGPCARQWCGCSARPIKRARRRDQNRAKRKPKAFARRPKTREHTAPLSLFVTRFPPCRGRQSPPLPSPATNAAETPPPVTAATALGRCPCAAPLCLLVKLAGVAEVDRHRHPARRRGQLRRGLGFRLRASDQAQPPDASIRRRRTTGEKRKQPEQSSDVPTKTPHHSSVARSARETAADKQGTTTSRSAGRPPVKKDTPRTPAGNTENVRQKGAGTQRVPRPALPPRPPRAPPRARA